MGSTKLSHLQSAETESIPRSKMPLPTFPNSTTKPTGDSWKTLRAVPLNIGKINTAPTTIGRISPRCGFPTVNMRFTLGQWTVGHRQECCPQTLQTALLSAVMCLTIGMWLQLIEKGNLKMKKKIVKLFGLAFAAIIAILSLSVCAFAEGGGDVAGAIENTWNTASTQIKQVVDNVVFPVIDLILAVFFFGKLGLAYFDYRKSGHFEWTAPAVLFACLVFTLTAPLYIWVIIA